MQPHPFLYPASLIPKPVQALAPLPRAATPTPFFHLAAPNRSTIQTPDPHPTFPVASYYPSAAAPLLLLPLPTAWPDPHRPRRERPSLVIDPLPLDGEHMKHRLN